MLHQLDLFGGEPVKIDGKGTPIVKRNNKSQPEKHATPAPSTQSVADKSVAIIQTPLPDLFEALVEEPAVELENPEPVLPTADADTEVLPAPLQPEATPALEADKEPTHGDPEVPSDEILFSKQYYPISEVAKMFKANVSLLRYWEKEFDIIKPRKNRKGDRLFRPEDIKNLKLIHFLLKEKKYTIKGAKTFLKKGKQVKEKFEAVTVLKNIRNMLVELKSALK
jgi:DNA-binding transcriptional MerR regulator